MHTEFPDFISSDNSSTLGGKSNLKLNSFLKISSILEKYLGLCQ